MGHTDVDRLNQQAKQAIEANDLETLEEIRTEFLSICTDNWDNIYNRKNYV